MNYRELEKQIKTDIELVFTKLLKDYNYILPISAKSRSGAEISDYLEDYFVDFVKQNPHERILNPLGSPKGKTKNPFDFCFTYYCVEHNFTDLIWGDIKATKFSYADSNPDLGTPEKIIKFINAGHFYLLFVFFEYEATEDNRTRFRKFSDGRYVHCQFLKDIHKSVRINPKPQFQVNINEKEEYRSINEFLDLFHKKYQESIDRNIKKQMQKKEELDDRFDTLKNKLNEYSNSTKIK